ncbi:MAG TPA: response regulator [Symbiobacteriaceae bacterium]|jgi:response regulator of citrate/malate metabolism
MLRVLIVEDDYRVARVNRGFVEQVAGFEVAGTAATAAEAERALRDLVPDLIILDLYLPDGNGLDLLRRLRSSGHPTDVIVVTAAKEAASVQEALRAGAVDYVLKPYRFERFAEALSRYREYRGQIAGAAQIEQDQVDRLLARRPPAREGDAVPKGIDPLTLEKVLHVIQEAPAPMAAEDLGALAGLSRTTARRYLEYLVETGRVRVKAAYGHVGRPERLYERA